MGSASLGMVVLALFIMGFMGFVSALHPEVVAGVSTPSGTANSLVIDGQVFRGYYDSAGRLIVDAAGQYVAGDGDSGQITATIGSGWTKYTVSYGDVGHVVLWYHIDGSITNSSVAISSNDYKVMYPAFYVNTTGTYKLYSDPLAHGNFGSPAGFGVVMGKTVWSPLNSNDDISSESGVFASKYFGQLTAIMVGVVAFVALVSVNVLSTGLNAFGTRALVVISFFSALWVFVTLTGVDLLTSVPMFGWLCYLFITFLYFLGVWGMINTGGSF